MEFIHNELKDLTNEILFVGLQEQLFWLQTEVIWSLSIFQVPLLCKSSKSIFLNPSYHSGDNASISVPKPHRKQTNNN